MFRRILALALLLMVPSLVWAVEKHTTDTLDTVKSKLADKSAVLLDVREPDEWKEGHLTDAKSLPLSKIKAGVSADDVAPLAPKGTIVYLHCASGVRSLKAAEPLRKLGYDVRPLKAGYKDLRDAGFAQTKP